MVRTWTVYAGAAVLCFGSNVKAEIRSERIATGLDLPMFAMAAPDQADKLYILERSGDIEILDLSQPNPTPTRFFTMPAGQVDTQGEGGALGLAFDPDFATNGRFYLNLTTSSSALPFRTEIRRYDADLPNTQTPEVLLSFNQPANNHNGGWIGFNPLATGEARHDLYIASGDGGGSNDPNNNAQDTTDNKLGKILRINVAGASGYTSPPTNPLVDTTGDDEILAHGLRNPFRASFDRQTGKLYIGDVGQNAREEVDVLDPAVIDASTGRAPVRNYGWRLREGTIATPTGGVGGSPPANNVDPIYDYQRPGTANFPDAFEGQSVTGGIVYRGPIAELQGLYIFGDYISNRIWAFDPADPYDTIQDLTSRLAPPSSQAMIANISAFTEDASGNLYILDLIDGEVFAVVPEPGAALLLTASGLLALRRRRLA